MNFELSYEQKEKFKKALTRNNSFDYFESNDLNDFNRYNLLNQFFRFEQFNEKITSWQVRVKIIELKNLVGTNETVYCEVEIGDYKFRTREKSIDYLNFSNEEDEVFSARIDDKKFQKSFNYQISISVL